MGVPLGKLIEPCKQKIELTAFSGKKLGFDASNTLFQFVTTIRGQDGQPLMNEKGEITSHLNGLFYRLLNLKSLGIDITFIFDGESPYLKKTTKQERRERRTIAQQKLEIAKEENDLMAMQKYARQAATINEKIINESKELLYSMGIPYIQAPGEAEAQIAFMVSQGMLDYCVSQDYDCFLFGSPNLLKNIAISGKKKLPYKNVYVDVYPTIIESKCIFDLLQIDRDQLIWLAILIGTDFNPKVSGIGPKTALEIVKKNNSFENIMTFLKTKNKEISFDYKEIENIFKTPNIDKNPKIEKGEFNRKSIEKILIDKANFSQERVTKHLDEYIVKIIEKEKQKTLSDWFR